jgi:hypothetical protein
MNDRLTIKGTIVDGLRQPLAGRPFAPSHNISTLWRAACTGHDVDELGAFTIVGLDAGHAWLTIERGFHVQQLVSSRGRKFESNRLKPHRAV